MTMAVQSEPVRTGYDRPRKGHDPLLTEVGRGTPMGELLRRYWQPVMLAADVNAETPWRVRVLGEDLIAFRDGSGVVGLVHSRCCHRGTDLYYGRIEERGIRCCYHGWLFAADGACLEMPCEPAGSTRPQMVRQPWYPVREYRGLIFAYMGPSERIPAFPVFDSIERDAERSGQILLASAGLGSGGHVVVPELGIRTGDPALPANWLQIFENVMDPYHVYILHMNMSGAQFASVMARAPAISWDETPLGIRAYQDRRLDDGKLFRRITEAFVPNVRLVPTPAAGEEGHGFQRGGLLSWVVPIDDTHTTFFSLGAFPLKEDGTPFPVRRSQFEGKNWEDLTEDEHRKMPGDYEAQVSQGPISIHAEEHLVMSDRGIMMLRQKWRRQLQMVEAGEDPLGVVRSQDDIMVETIAGNFIQNQADAAE
ncbi:MAG: Rieske 2Fe-2S domain-containing protein [Allosphingosinicella sp.]